MKKILIFFMTAALSIFVIPGIIVPLSDVINHLPAAAQRSVTADFGNGDAVTTGSFSDPYTLKVYITSTGESRDVDFEEYLVGVLAGEMSPTYHIEALKAQAVAARSYILSKIAGYMEGNIPEEHHGAMICTDYQHCKAWTYIQEAKAKWDSRFAEDYEAKLRRAVQDTKGEYMTYDNQVVKAFFYAISSGKTEDVADVWGNTLPYLKSVDSEGDRFADGYESLNTFSTDSFIQKLKEKQTQMQIVEPIESMIGKITRTKGGSVDTIEIGGQIWKGTEVRNIFGLRSANFSIQVHDDKVTFDVKGYGHGVGMSQNGANYMANRGKTYIEILKHYYSDVEFQNLYKKA